uniref:EF-hand domain-containing protein n=1 Tax=Alexandrium monilatum TaxID=311494 RepID=A0A7S4W2D4_9DINO
MAADVEHGGALASTFHQRLALLAREYERLDAENHSLRLELDALRHDEGIGSGKAWLPGLPAHWQSHGDYEQALPSLTFRHEEVHGMSPLAPSSSTVNPILDVVPMTPPNDRLIDRSSPRGRGTAFPMVSSSFGSDGCRTNTANDSSPICGWTLPDVMEPRKPTAKIGLKKAKTHNELSVAKEESEFEAPVAKRKTHAAFSDRSRKTSLDTLGLSVWTRGSLAPSSEVEAMVPRKPVFANAEHMKEKVRQQISKRPYSVADYYKKNSIWNTLATHPIFETGTLAVIAVNSIWIAVDADHNSADVLINAHPFFQVVENLFCAYFFGELFIRFMAFGKKRDCLRDKWFCFDFALVILMVSETWVMTVVLLINNDADAANSVGLGNTSVLRVFRLLRLTRMARMARLLRAMPELMILVKGMVSAMRCVGLMLLLLAVVVYIFSIGFQQLCKGTDVGKQHFGSVLEGMHTLWIRGALLDEVSELSTALQQESVFLMLALDFFLLIATLTVMNMLIGVLCEVVSAVAAAEREDLAVQYARMKLQRIFDDVLDTDGNKNISKEEFVKVIENREATRTMHDLDVDVVGLVDFADVIFARDLNDDDYERELSFADFMEVIIAFRGSNTATVKDIENLRKLICQTITKCENRIARLEVLLVSPEAAKGRAGSSNASTFGFPLRSTLSSDSHGVSTSLGGVRTYAD